MRRGEIRIVDLDPVRGSDAAKQRPAVIVSNDGANTTASRLGRGVVTVVPVTSNTARVYPFQVLLEADVTKLKHDSKAQAEQVRSIAVQRIGSKVGTVPPEVMARVDEGSPTASGSVIHPAWRSRRRTRGQPPVVRAKSRPK